MSGVFAWMGFFLKIKTERLRNGCVCKVHNVTGISKVLNGLKFQIAICFYFSEMKSFVSGVVWGEARHIPASIHQESHHK